jgi:hypothetical protein
LLLRLSSKIVLRLYLDDPGEEVKSLVKSDLAPYPMAAPLFLNEDEVS